MFDKLVDLVVQFLDLFKFWEVLDAYQRGVILRLGKFNREVGPGIHWLIPLGIDRVVEINVVTRTHDLRQSIITLKDGSTVCVSVVVRFNIRDAKKAILEVDGLEDVIKDSVFGNVSAYARSCTWEELNSPTLEENLTKACRKQAFRYGVEVESVVFSDLCRTRAIALLKS